MLERLTIIIPTVSRPDFVLRQFEYWRGLGPRVFILDGASAPIGIPKDLVSENVSYIHSGTRFNERLASAIQYVSTEFCTFLPDDEFYLPSGLRSAITHLDKNPNVIGCAGRCLYFFVDQGRFLVRDGYRDWVPFPIGEDSVSRRLDADLPPNKTHKAHFAIMRSPYWKKVFEASYRTYYSCGYTYERLANLQRTILGRTEIIESLLLMRSMENPPISDESMPRVAGRDFVSWATNPEFAREFLDFRAAARKIIEESGLPESQVKLFEERFSLGGIERQRTKELKNKSRISSKVGKFVLRFSPKWVSAVAKRRLPNALLKFSGWQGYELKDMYELLRAHGTAFDKNELEQIQYLSLKLDQQTRTRLKEKAP
ncbi:MAG: TIGR00180 family glycosyltransferase [Microbacteriaceae bacterium]|nr:TIGR00180 family glycosyltransferase [Microbacteriaceae bacterium]